MARRKTALPNSKETWIKFVKLRIEVFCRALDLLNVTDDIIVDEDEISKALNPKLVTICRVLKLDVGSPGWEAKNRPLTDNDIELPSADTRPDFTCNYYNTSSEFNESYEIKLHIECKRIGFDTSKSWHLNKNYISDGINRFDYLSHKYGEGANDGIMVGYIISSTKTDIQDEINRNLPENIEKLNFKTRNKIENITTNFKRENVEPFDFNMHHIWADFTKID